jgi:hypothetical protein
MTQYRRVKNLACQCLQFPFLGSKLICQPLNFGFKSGHIWHQPNPLMTTGSVWPWKKGFCFNLKTMYFKEDCIVKMPPEIWILLGCSWSNRELFNFSCLTKVMYLWVKLVIQDTILIIVNPTLSLQPVQTKKWSICKQEKCYNEFTTYMTWLLWKWNLSPSLINILAGHLFLF